MLTRHANKANHPFLSRKNMKMRKTALTLCFIAPVFSQRAPAAETATIPETRKISLQQGFLSPPDSCKPWVSMWWFDTITPADITQHLEELKAQGVGGATVIDLARMPQARFLSEEWRRLFRHTVSEASRLGLKLGSNVTAGWPSGGPWITPENSSWMVVSSETILKGGQSFNGKLAEPTGKAKLYEDVAVQAFPIADNPSPTPVISVSSSPEQAMNLLDGSYNTSWTAGLQGQQWILVDFGKPHLVDYAWIDTTGKLVIEGSDDGANFQTVANINAPLYSTAYQAVPATTYRWYRVQVPIKAVVHDVVLGTQAEVTQAASLAAKRALNSPMGIVTSKQTEQMQFVWQDLAPLPENRPLKSKAMVDLAGKISPDGTLQWEVPPGTWKVVRVGRTLTGMNTMPDYLSAAATKQNFDKALKLLIDDGGETLQYFREDNVEIRVMIGWTPLMIEEFRKRRGYDPMPYLAALAGEIVDSVEITDRFLADVRRTIADCIADYHYGGTTRLSNAFGVQFKSEAGGPNHPRLQFIDGLMSLGRVDIPEAEFWESSHWKENQFVPVGGTAAFDLAWEETSQNVNAKQAASAAHLYGKELTAAESFTSLGPRSHWGQAPADLLLYANVAFCEGINSMTIHGSATSGPQDGKPGKAFAAGIHFNHNVTWWKQSHAFLSYLSRCQYMLRQGRFVADVLYYNGDEIPNVVPPKTIDPSRGFGYDYDVCNTEILLTRLSVKDGRIVLPDGMSYRVLVLPERAVLPLTVANKIEELVRAGATVIGPRPQRTPGLTGYPQSESALKNIALKMWGPKTGATTASSERPYGKGRVVNGLPIRTVLQKVGVTPDFALQAADKNALVDFIHRRDGETDIYFVTNRRATPLNGGFTFRVSGKQPELWNPVTGETKDAAAFTQKGGRTTLPLELASYGSMFVLFKRPIASTMGGIAARNNPILSPYQILNDGWLVQFDPNWGGPQQPVSFAKLEDWTKRPEEGIKYYSGTATYKTKFDLPSATTGSASKMVLDLGEVKNLAEVRLNGKNLGVVWCAPWQVDISGAMKVGQNYLEIDIVNLWPNRIFGDSKRPPEKRLTQTNIAFGGKLLPSGLLGPVRLMRAE